MAQKRFPRPDGDFLAYMTRYYEAVDSYWNVQGLDLAALVPLKDAIDAYRLAFAASTAAHAAAQAATQAKDAARREAEAQARPITAFVQSYPATTDADRAAIGITVRDTSGTPSATPTTAPVAQVRSASRLTHTLRLTDAATPTRRAKPRGVLGAEVWVKLVNADEPTPTDPASLSFLTMAVRPTLTAEFRSGDGGKTAVYMARWVSTRGEKGPWSEVTSATVAA